jgi:hypothetical protein
MDSRPRLAALMTAAQMLVMLLAGCGTQMDLISTDLTRQKGLYVIAYVDREDIRQQVEDQFVEDLAHHDIVAFASRHDIPDIKRAQPAAMVRAANSHEVVALLIANRVSADGSDSIIESPQKITPANPDLQAYYNSTRQELDVYARDEPVFVEVNAFFVDGPKTRRFWTGTTWTFDTRNPDAAIQGISTTIAAQIAKVRDELRSYDRPMTDPP